MITIERLRRLGRNWMTMIARGRRAQLLAVLLMGMLLGGGLVGFAGEFAHGEGHEQSSYQTGHDGSDDAIDGGR
jgi:hypothetical protein